MGKPLEPIWRVGNPSGEGKPIWRVGNPLEPIWRVGNPSEPIWRSGEWGTHLESLTSIPRGKKHLGARGKGIIRPVDIRPCLGTLASQEGKPSGKRHPCIAVFSNFLLGHQQACYRGAGWLRESRVHRYHHIIIISLHPNTIKFHSWHSLNQTCRSMAHSFYPFR